MSNDYSQRLESARWCPGSNSNSGYKTFLIDARRWLLRRRHLDDQDRIGVLARLAKCETLRRFGFPKVNDTKGRDALNATALFAARYHEGLRDRNAQLRTFADAIAAMAVWERDRLVPSQEEWDRAVEEAPEDTLERIGEELIAGTLPDIEPAASFHLYYYATAPPGEGEENRRRMALVLERQDPEATWGGTVLDDPSMARTLGLVEQTRTGQCDRSMFDRDQRVPIGERAQFLLNINHAANGLRFRIGDSHVAPMVGQLQERFRANGRRVEMPVPGVVADRPSASVEALRTPLGDSAFDIADTDHLSDLDELDRLEVHQRLEDAAAALKATSRPSTVRFALLSDPDLLYAVLTKEMTQAECARKIGCDESTLRESLSGIARDLGNLAA